MTSGWFSPTSHSAARDWQAPKCAFDPTAMFDEKRAIGEIEERNRLRNEAWRAPLSLDDEIRRLIYQHCGEEHLRRHP
jgi:hypothetical protein